MLMRKMKANVMHNATKQNKKNYLIVFNYQNFTFFGTYIAGTLNTLVPIILSLRIKNPYVNKCS